jgi:hypothetical protein
LVAPTAENVAIIARDAAAGLYDRFHVNFITTLPRGLLEDSALKIMDANAASRIAKIVDLHNQFIGLEPLLSMSLMFVQSFLHFFSFMLLFPSSHIGPNSSPQNRFLITSFQLIFYRFLSNSKAPLFLFIFRFFTIFPQKC